MRAIFTNVHSLVTFGLTVTLAELYGDRKMNFMTPVKVTASFRNLLNGIKNVKTETTADD